MVKIHPRLLQEIEKLAPGTDPETLISCLATDLDLVLPQGHVKSLSLLSEDGLTVYSDGKKIMEEPLGNIASFRAESGVGCVFAEFETKDNKTVLFARADASRQSIVTQFVRSANRTIRKTARNGYPAKETGSTCPKCGRPYPRGSHTCPHCSSKKQALARLLGMAKNEWAYIAVTVLLFFVTTGIGLLTPYLNRVMVDDYIQNDDGAGRAFLIGFIGMVLSLLAVNVLRRLVGIARGYFLTVAGERLIVRLRDLVFGKIQKLSISSISRQTTGELMQRVNGDTSQIKRFLINQMPSILEQTLLLVAIAAVMLFYDWRLALLILVPAPFIALAFRMFWRLMRRLFGRRRELNARGSAVLHDIFSGIRVVKAYGMEKREEARFVDMAAAERDAQLRPEKLFAILMPILNFLMATGEYVLLYYVGTKMLAGQMTAGEMSQFSSYANMIYGPLRALLMVPRQFLAMMTSLTRIYELLDEPIDVPDSEKPEKPEWTGHIEIDRVSFGYEDADEILHDISLDIKPGEFVGLVGKSGVGKSTLINLIMRMYDVEDGSIRLDGVDIRNISQEELRSHMGVVLQENFLFTGTVWQNLTYAKPRATREEVIRAAKMAGAHEFIINLPDGYNTYVGERGHTLSGGERQRISIARAILHDPRILILDEATSALDTETEKLIQDALKKLCEGRTTIAIAHRLSTLRNATRLVVMDRGKIAETGTHEELMAQKGIYYGLVMAQREMTQMPNGKDAPVITKAARE